jgi:transcriptional regulator with XRE-family HTH domain
MGKSMKKRDGPRCPKPVQRCREFLTHAIAVRKSLKQLFRGSRHRGSGRNAMKLVGLIELLARKGQRTNAEEAVRIVNYIETLISMLDDEMDQILVRPGRQVVGLCLRLICQLRVFQVKSSIGETIRIIRTANDKTLRALAVASGLSVPYLSLVESGARQPSLTAIQKIAKALNVPAEVLLMLGMGPKVKLTSTDSKTTDITESVRKLISLENRLKRQLRSGSDGDEPD